MGFSKALNYIISINLNIMKEIKGNFNIAKVFTDSLEEMSSDQIKNLCNQEIYKDSKIRIMPDVHAGKGCTIGTTMTIKDKVCVNLVGVDIGCGLVVVELGKIKVDYEKLDKYIRKNIPSGKAVHSNVSEKFEIEMKNFLSKLKCIDSVNIDRVIKSVGSLGGGNHFIEIDEDDKKNKYLIVHSGSRSLGVTVAEHYRDIAFNKLNDNAQEANELIARLSKEGRKSEIQTELTKLKKDFIPREISYVEGADFDDYLHDMKITQAYASMNREEMVNILLDFFKKKNNNLEVKQFETIHNYIDTNTMILRKGAISANEGERMIIPLNMRDGCIIAIGKGNDDWNNSAPHGAGRVLSRKRAKEQISLDKFRESMKGIWTSSVSKDTLDESPMTYKPAKSIVKNIGDTVEIEKVIKPVYNFKAKE